MNCNSHAVFVLLILAAVLPEVITGAPTSEIASLKTSSRQTVGCTGRCFARVQNANRDCRRGIAAGNECIVRRGCPRGNRRPGFQCIFIRPAPPAQPLVNAADGTCPNRCFTPSTASAANIVTAQSSAQMDCTGRNPPCIVRPCSATPINGFICARACPGICRASQQMAANDCSLAVRCSVQSCILPSGAGGFICGAPPVSGGPVVAVSPSPTMSPGASPSVTSSVTPTPAASPSVTTTVSPTPTITVSPTPSPSCTFSVGAIGAAPATAFCRCGTRTETVTIPAAVDNLGMPLSVPNEVTGGNNYRDCVVSDLRALCSFDQIGIFSSTGTTRVENCCTRNRVDGMGLDRVTNQCKIGDGCEPVTMLATTALVMNGAMITCRCSGMEAMVELLNVVSTSGAEIPDIPAGQGTNAENYNTCLRTSLGALCTSSGFATFNAMGTTAVSTCCTNLAPNGADGMLGTVGNDCILA